MNAYWYISDAKVDQLRQTIPRSWSQDLVLKLKFKTPWLEVEVGHRDIKAAITNCELIERTLRDNAEIFPFESADLGADPVFVGFNMDGARAVANDGFWIAGYSGKTALLLVGSTKHAVGAQGAAASHISPSINPIGAANALTSDGVQKTTAENLSYAWQEIFRSGAGSIRDATLPLVEGIALFGGRFPAVKAQVRRAGHGDLTHLVIGTPVFARQANGASAA
jgi:hypothetical protein